MKASMKMAMLLLYVLATLQVVGQVAATRPSTLDELRGALRAGSSIDVGSAHIRSLVFANEVRLSGERTAILLVGDSTGALVLFSANGRLAASTQTSRIVTFQVVELEDDGVSGIVTDEVQGSGTDILIRQFKFYSFTNNQQIKLAWQARSFWRETPWSPNKTNPKVTTERGYVRFDPSGGGFPARMSYAFRNASGHWTMKLYRLGSDDIQEITATSPSAGSQRCRAPSASRTLGSVARREGLGSIPDPALKRWATVSRPLRGLGCRPTGAADQTSQGAQKSHICQQRADVGHRAR